MLLYKDIIKEENQFLYQKSVDVSLPLTDDDQATLLIMNDYLKRGYDETLPEDANMRPGVGLAAPQVGVLKKMFVVMTYDEEENFHHFAVINPRIVSNSIELAYIPSGEGCLSVERTVKGLIHRSKRITLDGYFYDFNTGELTREKRKFKNYLSIVVQHEYDHLQGILFTKKIDPANPFFVPENSTPVVFNDEE